MCGRYALSHPEHIATRFDITSADYEYAPSFNVAPGTYNPIVTQNSPKIASLMKWGLIPHWAKDEKIGYKMINARAETIDEKTSFKNAFRSKRCIVPTSGFYEWKQLENTKIPYFITLDEEELFGLAGIYEEWTSPTGELLKSYAIITTQPNNLMADIHTRMPVILPKESEDEWLRSEDQGFLKSLLKPYDDEKMEAYPVSKEVNSPRNNNPQLIEPQNTLL